MLLVVKLLAVVLLVIELLVVELLGMPLLAMPLLVLSCCGHWTFCGQCIVDSGRRSHDFLLIEVAVSKDFLAFFYSINPTHMAKLTD